VVHRGGASPATVTTPKTAAAWQPAAGLCRARRCANRTSAAASGRSAMKQSGLRGVCSAKLLGGGQGPRIVKDFASGKAGARTLGNRAVVVLVLQWAV
jgi:hypothetical protein